LPGTNTLAYNENLQITAVKVFITLALVVVAMFLSVVEKVPPGRYPEYHILGPYLQHVIFFINGPRSYL
jgi:hypothetical protein